MHKNEGDSPSDEEKRQSNPVEFRKFVFNKLAAAQVFLRRENDQEARGVLGRYNISLATSNLSDEDKAKLRIQGKDYQTLDELKAMSFDDRLAPLKKWRESVKTLLPKDSADSLNEKATEIIPNKRERSKITQESSVWDEIEALLNEPVKDAKRPEASYPEESFDDGAALSTIKTTLISYVKGGPPVQLSNRGFESQCKNQMNQVLEKLNGNRYNSPVQALKDILVTVAIIMEHPDRKPKENSRFIKTLNAIIDHERVKAYSKEALDSKYDGKVLGFENSTIRNILIKRGGLDNCKEFLNTVRTSQSENTNKINFSPRTPE